MAWSFGQQGDAPKSKKKKRLTVSRASAQADTNAGSANPYLNTRRKQAYTGKSVSGHGGTLKGGKSPGNSGRSSDLRSQRASTQNDKIASGKLPLLPNNTIGRKEHDQPGKAPYSTNDQRAAFEKRTTEYYDRLLKQARRKASRKWRNGSTTQVTPHTRGDRSI